MRLVAHRMYGMQSVDETSEMLAVGYRAYGAPVETEDGESRKQADCRSQEGH